MTTSTTPEPGCIRPIFRHGEDTDARVEHACQGIECPRCHAPRLRPCRSPAGWMLPAHDARRLAAGFPKRPRGLAAVDPETRRAMQSRGGSAPRGTARTQRRGAA